MISGAYKVAQKNKIEEFLTPNVIQNFLFTYIDQKMRTEKFTMLVGKQIEQFLGSLEKPLQLNEMRVMKEANYQKFRSLLSDLTVYGDEVLALIREQHELFGVPSSVYDMVYEGFWDLYCKKPDQTAEIPPKKLEGFITKVKLVTPPVPTTEEDGSTHPAVTDLPLKAIIRIRIPLIRPKNHLEKDDETPDDVEGDGTASPPGGSARGPQGSHEHQQLSTHPDEDTSTFNEMPLDDRAILINNVQDQTRVWVIHQASQRLLRKDITVALKKSTKELDEVDMEELVRTIEEHAVEVEKTLVKIFSIEGTNEFDEIRAKVLNGSTAPIPTFDYEPILA